MSDVISRFREDLQLAGLKERSVQSYASAVLRLQRFFNKPLKDITEEDLRQYWLTCKEEFGWSASTLRISYSAFKHFFSRTLIRTWPVLDQVRFKRDITLPTVLSCRETKLVIDHMPTLQSKTFYTALYSLGLRLKETCTLQIRDILSDRQLVHLHLGKGSMDRVIPLPKITLESLRAYYKTHRNSKWIFPALGHNNGKNAGTAAGHVSKSGVQGVLKRTVKRLRITKHVHPHVFRHSYATHLIEANVPIRHVQKILGHKTLASTMVYLHVTTHAEADSHQRVAQIIHGILS